MTKKQISFIVLGIAAIVLVIYFFVPSKPSAFLSNEKLVNQLSGHYEDVTIKDVLDVEEGFKIIVYTTASGAALSYWEYRNRSWKMYGTSKNMFLDVWRLDPKDPAKTYFVWHLPENVEAKKITVHLLQDRHYSMSENSQFYTPRMMLQEVLAFDNSYGVMQISPQWQDVLTEMQKAVPTATFFQPSPYYYGYSIVDEDMYPYLGNGSGSWFGSSKSTLEYPQYIDIENLRQ